MKKNILAILVAAAGAWAAWADYATTLKYDDVPAHVTLTFSGSFQGDVNVSVAGAAAGATLSQYSYGSRGWTITATADTGYDEPVFRTCPYDDTGDILAETQIHTGSVTRTGYNIHVYDITVSPKLVTVYFNLVGGDLPAGASSSRIVPYDSAYGALPVPTRKGYTFDGWFTESEGGTQVTESDKMALVASTQTLYAHWTPIKYTVAFKANGGSGTMPSMTLTYDQSASLVANAFTRAYYTFDKWRTTDGNYYGDCASVVNLAETEGAVVTLLAQWMPMSYTITFDSTGGTPIEAVTCQFGAAVSRPTEDPTRDGYTFVRWSPALPEKMPPTNLTVRAIWRVDSYKLSFDANGGDGNEAMSDVTAAAGSELTLPPNAFTRTGFAFAGWNTQPDGAGLAVADGARWSLTSNTTFYARWTPYVVTFSLADGGSFRQDSIDALKASGSVSNVEEVGEHTLRAWFTEGRQFGVLPDATNVTAYFSLKLKNWRFVRDGVYQAIATNTIVPPLALGGTNLVAQWDWEPSDELAAALDTKNLAWSIDHDWTADSQQKIEGGQSVLIQESLGNYADGMSYKFVKLTTTLVGPGTLTFDWRMESAAIGSLQGGVSTWAKTPEGLMFCIGEVNPSSGTDLANKFKRGFVADSNNWVSVTNSAGTGGLEGEIGSLNGGWESCTITDLAGAGADEINTVTWVYQYMKDTIYEGR